MNEAFGRRMRKLRGDMRQVDFADKVGVPQQYISRWEQGQWPSVAALMQISRETKVSLDWLLFGPNVKRTVPQ